DGRSPSADGGVEEGAAGTLPYHIRVRLGPGPGDEITQLDLDDRELEERVLAPYRAGRPIFLAGRSISPETIGKLRINRTDLPAKKLLSLVHADPVRRPDAGTAAEDVVARWGRDVTDEMIAQPAAVATIPAVATAATVAIPAGAGGPDVRNVPDPRNVFVVHGRDTGARDAMFAFLRAVGLRPIEWNEAVRATGHPTPYIGEILTTAFASAQAIVVLLTPDDDARLAPAFWRPDDPPHERAYTGQPRANVLFEAGMAMAVDARRTVLVEVGRVRPFSDIAGRLVLHLNNSGQRRQELAQRLAAAGCPIDLGGIDWHSAGNFEATVAHGPSAAGTVPVT
ncbi:nucleotide-binding protein, partial [Candidatus Protofrankia datiscae]